MQKSAAAILATLLCGCSIQRVVVDRVGDALSKGSGGYGSDEDPELVRDASPFALKAVEGLLSESPNNKGLLLAACSGFTQYGHAFVQDEADYIEAKDLDRATAMRARARKLYLRAREYGLRGLEAALPGFRTQLKADPGPALARVGKEQLAILYYTGASWAAAFALDVADPALAADQTLIEQIMRRALVLDPAWDGGAAHEFFVAWEAGHALSGGSVARARGHFQAAVRLSNGMRASAYVTLAEAVPLQSQDAAEFTALLNTALAIDPGKDPSHRQAILAAQRRARWLLSRRAELFNEPEPKENPS
jgi:predicted anti-sigma-YlaC factor YlaD